jgi:hypothetical protein
MVSQAPGCQYFQHKTLVELTHGSLAMLMRICILIHKWKSYISVSFVSHIMPPDWKRTTNSVISMYVYDALVAVCGSISIFGGKMDSMNHTFADMVLLQLCMPNGIDSCGLFCSYCYCNNCFPFAISLKKDQILDFIGTIIPGELCLYF